MLSPQALINNNKNNTNEGNKQKIIKSQIQKQQDINNDNNHLQFIQYLPSTNQTFIFKYRQPYSFQKLSISNRLSSYFHYIAGFIIFKLVIYAIFVYQTISSYQYLQNHHQHLYESFLNIHIGLFILLHFFLLLNIISYIQIIITSPGIQVQITERQSKQIHKKLNNLQEIRYCDLCKIYKLPQTSHSFQSCILQYEITVPIFANTIGKFNLKYYILYFFYLILTLFISFILLIIRLVYLIINTIQIFHDYSMKEKILCIFHILGVFVFVLLIIFLIILSCVVLDMNICQIINRVTIIERLLYQRIQTENFVEKIQFRVNKYSMIRQNIQRVLGTNPLLWVIPIQNNFLKKVEQKMHLYINLNSKRKEYYQLSN